jgi:DNA-binding transcriptional LysR family regulator
MISLKQLEAFLASAQQRNFVAAAARLHTTQSNVSKRIQELEWAVGAPVFERGPRALTLTIKGKQLLPKAEEVLAAYGKFTDLANPDSPYSGPFNIGSVPAIALSWLSVFMHQVRGTYTGLVLNTHVDAKRRLAGALTSGVVDLVFTPLPFEAPETETVQLATEELVWVCHPSLAPKTRRMKLDQLAALPMIEHPSDDNQIRHLFSSRGIRPNIVATCTDFITRARFASSGLGVTHLPRYVVQPHLAAGTLVTLDSEIPLPPLRYAAVFRRGDPSQLPLHLTKIAAECCDFLLFHTP